LQTKRNYTLFTLLLKRIGLAFGVFTVCRIIYYFYNANYFPDDFWQIPKSLIFGILFDASTIAYLFLPFTLLSILPIKWQKSNWYQQVLRILFLSTITLAVTANLADAIYFKFARKRSGIEALTMLTDEGNPVGNYAATYWPWLLVIFAIVGLTFYLYVFGYPDIKKSIKKWWFYAVVLLGVALAARGSIGLKPLKTFDAARFVSSEYVPVTVNTPFNIISTLQGSKLDRIRYFEDSFANSIVCAEKINDSTKKPPNSPNIVIIILESFSRDYCGWLRGQELYTPFLDSLSQLSLNFSNAYANGSISMEGLPAIMAGIPSFMEVPYINSSYQNNKIKNIGKLLGAVGYESSFYHGADNGTMGFRNFLKISGWDNYYGITEYPNSKKDFDNSWGIFDEPYLQYVANSLKNTKKPFVAGLFTLTSHDPYPLPKEYNGIFKTGTLPIHPTIQYTDNALRLFFKQIALEPWFTNTIFIITADHSSHSKEEYFYTASGKYEIPLIIYDPGKKYVKPKTIPKTVNQIDILPTVLDLVNFPHPYFALGQSVLDTNIGFAYQKNGSVYQVISYPYVAQMKHNGKFIFFKQYKESTDRHYDLFPEEYAMRKLMLRKLLSFIQIHHNRLIDNNFYIDTP